MVALSGFACLVYQILWARQVAVLFGNTTHAAALTLAVFFGGLSLGSWLVGTRCRSLSNPFRAYAWLEGGIALAGVAVLAGPVVVPRLYPLLGAGDAGGWSLVALEAAWTVVLVLPAAMCMGGTLPVAGQALMPDGAGFGRDTARLYAVNTIGAAAGAFTTAFLLIWLVGIRITCLTAMTVSLTAAMLATWLARPTAGPVGVASSEHRATATRRKTVRPDGGMLPRWIIVGLAFVSGFNVLALEVVWARMLAQVHENSVYSFATVLIVVLACLAIGAWLASRLAGSGVRPSHALLWLIVAGGVALGVSPLVFLGLTGGARMLDTDFSFATYVLRLFATTGVAIGPACVVLGAVFPFLMKGEEAFLTSAGASIGRLAAVNTLGAILGSLAAGFVLLEWLGVWGSIQFVAVVYLLMAFFLPATGLAAVTGRVAAAAMLLLVVSGLGPNRSPSPVSIDHRGEPETVLETLEGSDCTVTVVRDSRNDLGITINSNYSLGSTAAYGPQIFQSRIPLHAYPATESVFFLGMGTGITAGDALVRDLFPQIRTVVACELSANVVAASRKYFTGREGEPDPTNGLHRDPRARVIVGDGRIQLLTGRDRYSMINADLFLPYRRGTGSLYSREHFRIVRERLAPGGVFVQWLPLYQMTEREFGVIATTMLAEFPQVTLWRGNFQPGAEIAALMGHADAAPLPACSLAVADAMRQAVEGATYHDMHSLMLPINEQTVTLFYAGNLTRAADLVAHHPVNTDDRPVIEFGTPRSLHRPAGVPRPHFLEHRFADFVSLLQARTPPDDDPFLARRTAINRRLPLAGSAFHRAWIASAHGDEKRLAAEWAEFLRLWSD